MSRVGLGAGSCCWSSSAPSRSRSRSLVAAFNLMLAQRLSDADADLARRPGRRPQIAALGVRAAAVARRGRPTTGALRRLRLGLRGGAPLLERAERGPPSIARPAGRSPAGRGASSMSPRQTRLYALPVVEDGRRFGTVVAGVSLAPYEETRRTALIALAVCGAALLLVAVTLARAGCSRARCDRSCA